MPTTSDHARAGDTAPRMSPFTARMIIVIVLLNFLMLVFQTVIAMGIYRHESTYAHGVAAERDRCERRETVRP